MGIITRGAVRAFPDEKLSEREPPSLKVVRIHEADYEEEEGFTLSTKHCDEPGCTKEILARGKCKHHWAQLRKREMKAGTWKSMVKPKKEVMAELKIPVTPPVQIQEPAVTFCGTLSFLGMKFNIDIHSK